MKKWIAGERRWVIAVAIVCVVLGMILTGCAKTARERAIEAEVARKEACKRDLKALGEAMNVYLTKLGELEEFTEELMAEGETFKVPPEPAASAEDRDYKAKFDAAMKAIGEMERIPNARIPPPHHEGKGGRGPTASAKGR